MQSKTINRWEISAIIDGAKHELQSTMMLLRPSPFAAMDKAFDGKSLGRRRRFAGA